MSEKPKHRKTTTGPLDNLTRVRRELGRCYRSARNGEMDREDLRAFVYALRTLAELLDVETIETRLSALEDVLRQKDHDTDGPYQKPNRHDSAAARSH